MSKIIISRALRWSPSTENRHGLNGFVPVEATRAYEPATTGLEVASQVMEHKLASPNPQETLADRIQAIGAALAGREMSEWACAYMPGALLDELRVAMSDYSTLYGRFDLLPERPTKYAGLAQALSAAGYGSERAFPVGDDFVREVAYATPQCVSLFAVLHHLMIGVERFGKFARQYGHSAWCSTMLAIQREADAIFSGVHIGQLSQVVSDGGRARLSVLVREDGGMPVVEAKLRACYVRPDGKLSAPYDPLGKIRRAMYFNGILK